MMEDWLPEERSIVALGDQVRVVMGDADGVQKLRKMVEAEP